MKGKTMKNFKALLISLLICAAVIMAAGMLQETIQTGHNSLRTGVTADDTPLDGATKNLTYAIGDKPSTAATVHPNWNNVQIYFYGTDAANETCNFKLYAYREDGPAVLVCYGSFILGTAVTGGTSEYYADTISITDVWPAEVVVSDSGNNRVCTLAFDVIGYKYLYCEIDIPASGQVASAGARFSGF